MPATDPQIFTIPPHVAFVDALAAGLLDRTRDDPLGLARARIFLPNRRAVRALTGAFVRQSGEGLLLPRMTPIGDLDADEALGSFDSDLDSDLPPAIDPTKRRLLLAQLIRRWRDLTAIEALRLADQLAAALDALALEEVDASALLDVVPDDMAHHWEHTLAFLRVVVELWPPLLASHGEIDPAVRHNGLLTALAARWRTPSAPSGLVVAAGMANASWPVGRLLASIARLPNGMVVLPGLDTAMDEAAWDAVHCHLEGDRVQANRNSEEHPQFGLKCLLHHIGVARGEVRVWAATSAFDGPPARSLAVARAMSPAAFTGDWREHPIEPTLFADVRSIVADTPEEEAQVVALALRRAVETPGKTAALVTPDRGLARRVAAHCARWGIAIDDSAGTPLRVTPPGALLLALVEAAARGFTPVHLLAVLKHPLVRAGDARLAWLGGVRALDLVLRGVRPAPGLGGVAARIDEAEPRLLAWWHDVAAVLDPLERLFARPLVGFAGLVAGLREAASTLCGDDLWARPEGRALAAVTGALERYGEHLDPFVPGDAPALIAAFLGETAVRQGFGTHPRLAIYGALEARLQRADLMILGGLNEGVWPQRAVPDPWLAPKVRALLLLPSLERRTGLAAHDFVAGVGGREVLLTRARRDDGAPAVPSRFWLRLQASSGGAIRPDDDLLGWARTLDRAARPAPALRPAPCPPSALRPRRISVTAAERLKADPFSWYAGSMLGLRPLDPLDADPGAADRGIAVHAILEAWVKGGDPDPARLAHFTEAELLRWSGHPLMRALWAPRVRRAMDWVAATTAAWEAEGWTPLRAETEGQLDLPNGVRLTGKADRVDGGAAGLAIIDYKTGVIPSHAQVAGGFALQMGLLGWLAEAGALGGVPPVPVAAVRYWKLGGGKEPGMARDPLKFYSEVTPPDEHIAATKAHFLALCDDWLLGTEPFTAKLHPEYSAKYRDYDQLARVLEWLGRPRMQGPP